MSHLSTIKTKLQDRELLVKSLEILGYSIESKERIPGDSINQELHERINVKSQNDQNTANFVWSHDDNSYALITDLDQWSWSIPVERFLAQITQRYALNSILTSCDSEGFQIKEQTQTDEGAFELIVTRWES